MPEPKKFPVYLTFNQLMWAKSVFDNAPVERDEREMCKEVFDAFEKSWKDATTPNAFKTLSELERLSNLEEDVNKLREILIAEADDYDPPSFRDLLVALYAWARKD